jgi:hypothetical protein
MRADSDPNASDEEHRLPHVRSAGDIARHDRSPVIVEGRYEAIARPRKGGAPPGAPHELAVVVLEDGTRIYLEPLDSEHAVRPRDERHRFDGQAVQVTGVMHAIMPSRGQSLIAPCLSAVRSVTPRRPAGGGA